MAVRVNKGLMHEIVGSRETPLVLSIQSHVIHGYVGNKVATLLLQLMGVHVDWINSVQFVSQFNHNGTKTSSSDLNNYFHHMKDSGLNTYSHFLTGFVGSVEYLRSIISFFKEFKELAVKEGRINPLWVCDPVLGDHDEIYTAEGLLEVFRDEALAVADIITPNHFELKWLCGRNDLSTVEQVLECCDELHEKGVGMIVVTSVPLIPGKLSMIVSANPVNASTQTFEKQSEASPRRRFRIDFDNKNVALYGTGDLVASAIVATLSRFGAEYPQEVCLQALALVQTAIEKTMKDAPEGRVPVELDIVGARKELIATSELSTEEILSKGLYTVSSL